MHLRVSRCPACSDNNFEISRLTCRTCGTVVEGHFVASRFAHLSEDNLSFAETFLKCRGNIKDVERELGISYPTVRSRLDRLIQAMGLSPDSDGDRRKDILAALEQSEMSPEEAIEALKDLRSRS